MLSIVTDRYQLLWFTRLHYAKQPRMHMVVTMPNRNKMRAQIMTYQYQAILRPPVVLNLPRHADEKSEPA